MNYGWDVSTRFPAKDGFKLILLTAYDINGEVLHTSEGGSLCKIKFLSNDLDVDVLPIIIQESQFRWPDGTTDVSSEVITSIINLNDDKAANSAVAYDLTGRKTTANAPGIKVINGKKIVIK